MRWRSFGLVVCLGAACGGGAAKSPATPTPPEIAVTPAGATMGSPSEMLVPVAGGKLVSADGRLTVDVPADALPTELALTVQPIVDEAPGGVGLAYRLGPEGTTFAKPVTLTFSYIDDDLVGSEPAALGVAFQDAQGQWNTLKSVTRDEARHTISAVTTHFSDWTIVEGFQLRPPTATVRPGHSVEFAVYNCSNRVAGTDELAELRYICRPDPDFFAVTSWAANGVAGGNASVGRFGDITETAATYTAPATVPANNPVAVSAAATDRTTRRKTVLAANVFVTDYPTLVGRVRSKQKDAGGSLVITTDANVTFVWNNDEQFYLPGAGSTLTAKWDVVENGCETHGMFTKDLTATDGAIVVLELGYFPTGAATGTLMGTTSCDGGKTTEPFELVNEVEWWPSPVESILVVKPDGKFADAYVDQLLPSGKTVSADWSLAPVTM